MLLLSEIVSLYIQKSQDDNNTQNLAFPQPKSKIWLNITFQLYTKTTTHPRYNVHANLFKIFVRIPR